MPMMPIRFADIVAVRPVYENGCIASAIRLMSGSTVTILRKPQTVVRQVLARDAIGWKEYRARFAGAAYGRQCLPVAHRGIVLMTCKMMHARVRGDATYGFVRLDLVDRVEVHDGVAVLVLTNGACVETVVKPGTVWKDQQRASMLLHRWQRELGAAVWEGRGAALPVRVHSIVSPDDAAQEGAYARVTWEKALDALVKMSEPMDSSHGAALDGRRNVRAFAPGADDSRNDPGRWPAALDRVRQTVAEQGVPGIAEAAPDGVLSVGDIVRLLQRALLQQRDMG